MLIHIKIYMYMYAYTVAYGLNVSINRKKLQYLNLVLKKND